MQTELPQAVKNTLWSYDTSKIDLTVHKNRIIFQVLNNGNLEAVHWLKQTYANNDLVSVLENSAASAWSKKSLNYWSLLLKSKPTRIGRFS